MKEFTYNSCDFQRSCFKGSPATAPKIFALYSCIIVVFVYFAVLKRKNLPEQHNTQKYRDRIHREL